MTPKRTLRALAMAVFLSGFSACSVLGPTSGGQAYDFYRVKSGDSLWDISQRYDTPVRAIQNYNGIENPKHLQIGSVLRIPREVGQAAVKKRVRARHASGALADISTPTSGAARLAWPLKEGRFMSGFGPRKRSFHDGIDIAAQSGTPVYASHSGVVAFAGSGLTGYGKLVIIRGDDRLYTVYAHNSRIFVKKGKRIKRGQQIAQVGSTGKSSGPHLHFEVRMKDAKGRVVALDPIPLLNRFARRRPRYRVNESLTPIFAKLGW